MAAVTVAFSELDAWLQAQPENTADTPYQIKVINLTANNIGSSNTSDTLGYVIKQNSTKYIDLSVTAIPDSVTDMTECFDECTTLVKSPAIPNSVTNMSFCFTNCTSLEEVILENPSNITSFNYVFEDCTALTTFKSDVVYTTKNWLETVKSVYPTYLPKEVDEYILETINNPPEIPFSWLNDELKNSPANTTDTAYEIKVTELTVSDLGSASSSGILGYVLSANKKKYVDLSSTELPDSVTDMSFCFMDCKSLTKAPVIPDSVTNMLSCFFNCTSLTKAPVIPNTVTNMGACFESCESLTKAPVIPDSVTYMSACFFNCTSLTEAYFENPSNITDYEKVFYGCTALTTFKSDRPYETKEWLTTVRTASTDNLPNAVDTYTFDLLTTPAEIPFSLLTNELSALSANTAQTPYEIKVTELTANDLAASSTSDTLGYVLNANKTKYVDLSSTELPDNVIRMSGCFNNCTSLTEAPAIPNFVTEMTSCFVNCTSLTKAPVIPDSVTDMSFCFMDCKSLTKAPVIPDSVTEMSYCFDGCTALTEAPVLSDTVTNLHGCFDGCTSLTEAPVIPDSVIYMSACFYGCTSIVTVPNVPASVTSLASAFQGCTALESIDNFEVPLSVLKTSDAKNAFYFCTSLTEINVPNPTHIKEDDDWHLYLLDVKTNSVNGYVYDKKGNVITIPDTSIIKSKLILPVYTDELLFSTNLTLSQLDEIAQKVIKYKYGIYNRETIEPDKKTFVLYADDPKNFITNLPITQKSTFDLVWPVGSTYTQYPQQKSPNELWGNISTWQIVNYGGAFFRAEGGNALAFNGNIKAITAVSGNTITIASHGATAGTVIYDFTYNESRVVKSVSGNVITLNSQFSHTNLRDVLIGQNSANLTHTHTFTGTAVTTASQSSSTTGKSGAHSHTFPKRNGYNSSSSNPYDGYDYLGSAKSATQTTSSAANHTHSFAHTHSVTAKGTNSNSGGDESRPVNMTERIWVRIA